MHAHELSEALSSLLVDLGASITEAAVRSTTRECRDEIYADTRAHGGRIEDPFFNFIVSDGVAVFTFFEAEFSVFVVRCDEAELISAANAFAMVDTLECKAFLATRYDKAKADLVVSRAVGEYWLEFG